MEQNYQSYIDGNEKISHELDLITIIHTMRKAEILGKLLVDKHQEKLIENHPINHIYPHNLDLSDYPKKPDPPEEIEDLIDGIDDLKIQKDFNYEDRITKKLVDDILGVKEPIFERNESVHFKKQLSQDENAPDLSDPPPVKNIYPGYKK